MQKFHSILNPSPSPNHVYSVHLEVSKALIVLLLCDLVVTEVLEENEKRLSLFPTFPNFPDERQLALAIVGIILWRIVCNDIGVNDLSWCLS